MFPALFSLPAGHSNGRKDSKKPACEKSQVGIFLYLFVLFVNIQFYIPENPDLPDHFVCPVAYISSNGVPKEKLVIF